VLAGFQALALEAAQARGVGVAFQLATGVAAQEPGWGVAREVVEAVAGLCAATM